MHILPDNLRNLLREPIGQLVNENELIDILKNEKYIVSIGDLVTYTILKNKIAYENIELGSLRIEVDGEEDLASLAAIYMAPPDVTIIYGLPDKGVLVVKSNNENKRKVKDILNKM